MMKHGIDQDALISQFSKATAQQGETLRKAVTEATLKALQGRELTLANIKQVLGTVTKAASTGAASNPLAAADVEGLLNKAVSGMDDALEKAVEANRLALQQMVDQGVSVRETQLKKALSDIEKMEDSLFAAVRKAAADAEAADAAGLGRRADRYPGQGHRHRCAGSGDPGAVHGLGAAEPSRQPGTGPEGHRRP